MKTLREQIQDRYEDVKQDDLVKVKSTGLAGFRVSLFCEADLLTHQALITLYRRDESGNYLKLEERKLSWSEQLKRAGAKEDDIAVAKFSHYESLSWVEVTEERLNGDLDTLVDFPKSVALLSLYRLNQETGRLDLVWEAK